jgi:hypothetical protein
MKVPEISTQGIYDYVEAVDSGSSLSTPNSGNHEPFASEFLGETVIHLDKVATFIFLNVFKSAL